MTLLYKEKEKFLLIVNAFLNNRFCFVIDRIVYSALRIIFLNLVFIRFVQIGLIETDYRCIMKKQKQL